MRIAWGEKKGFRQSACLAELKIRPALEFCDGVSGKKIFSNPFLLGFLGDGLDPVFAIFPEFGTLIIGIRPSASRTIYPTLLVEAKHDLARIPGGHIRSYMM